MYVYGEVGATEYVSCLDRIKTAAFLREQGMSDDEIATFTIHFVRFLPSIALGAPAGIYDHEKGKHVVKIATRKYHFSSYTEASKQEVLYELNEILMHEIFHALDKNNKSIQRSATLVFI